MIGFIRRVLICVSGALLFSACSANHHSIYRHQPVAGETASLTSVDAKQRVIMTSGTAAKLRFCAEPSPDVFSVLAQSLSAGGVFGQRADPASIEASLNAAFGTAEQGSTIPRTQTVNMLREIMYRTCERYLNGELSDLDMPVQAIRDQRSIVSILAIEQLTGAVTPRTVAIGSTANAEAGSSGADAVKRLDEAHKLVKTKQELEKTRQAAYDDENADGACEAIAKKVTDGTELTEDESEKKNKCDKAATELATAKTEHSEAAAHYATLKSSAVLAGIPVSSSADATHVEIGTDQASHDVSAVAHTVRDIVDMNFNQDEFLLFCIRVLNVRVDEEVKESCIRYVGAILIRKASEMEVEAAQNTKLASQLTEEAVAQSQRKRDMIMDGLFNDFWEIVRDPNDTDQADKGALKAHLQSVFGSRIPKCFDDKTVFRDPIRDCFEALEDQDVLLDLAGRPDPELSGD